MEFITNVQYKIYFQISLKIKYFNRKSLKYKPCATGFYTRLRFSDALSNGETWLSYDQFHKEISSIKLLFLVHFLFLIYSFTAVYYLKILLCSAEQAFGFTYNQISTTIECFVEFHEQLILHLFCKIDHYIPA